MAIEISREEQVRFARLQDFADLQQEMTGVQTGRMQRFTAKAEFQRRAAAQQGQDPDDDYVDAMLAQIAYQQTYEQFMRDLEIQSRAADLALHDIDRDIAENLRQRDDMLERAYRVPDGRRVFMTADGKAAYDESGNKLSDDLYSKLPRDQFRNSSTWEEFTKNDEQGKRLEQERQQVDRFRSEGVELRRRAEAGELTKDDLQRLERQREQTLPDRVRQHIDRLNADIPQLAPDASTTLSPDELARAGTRTTSAGTHPDSGEDFPTAPALRAAFVAAAAGETPTPSPADRSAAVPTVLTTPGPI